jgi:hypothetical protein
VPTRIRTGSGRGDPDPIESGRFERALGQHVADGALLHADLHALGDLHRDEAVADRGRPNRRLDLVS